MVRTQKQRRAEFHDALLSGLVDGSGTTRDAATAAHCSIRTAVQALRRLERAGRVTCTGVSGRLMLTWETSDV